MQTKRPAQEHGRMNKWTDIAVMTILSAFSVYRGQVSVFYICYLFWWSGLLSVFLTGFFDRMYIRKKESSALPSGTPYGLLFFIYWVFIVLVFGCIAYWDDKEMLRINFDVLFFKNLSFNLNLGYIIIEIIVLNVWYKGRISARASGSITVNMIILHVSIILGTLVLFMVVRRFPEVFTPDNRWGAVLVITPFLLVRLFIQLAKSGKR